MPVSVMVTTALVARALDGDPELTLGRHVAAGVVHQVAEHLAEPRRIRLDDDRRLRRHDADLVA